MIKVLSFRRAYQHYSKKIIHRFVDGEDFVILIHLLIFQKILEMSWEHPVRVLMQGPILKTVYAVTGGAEN